MWEDNRDPELRTIIQQPLVKHDSWIDGVLVPAAQCGITGFLAGVTAGILAALASSPAWWKWGAATWTIVTLGSWLYYRQGWQARLELMLGIDLNHDGRIGPAPQPQLPPPQPVKIILEQDQGRHTDIIDLPAEPEQLRLLAAGIIHGRSFAQSVWVGPGLFTRPQFDQIRDECIKRGLAAWKNPDAKNQGCELTPAGRAVFRRLASPTLPAGEAREE